MSLPSELLPVGLLGTGAAAAEGYTISRSLRFNSADSAYLSRTPASAGNRKTWTWAGWVKRGTTGTDEVFFFAGNDASDNRTERARFYFQSNEIFLAFGGGTGSTNISFSGPVYRDPSAWFHLVISADTNESNVSNAFKVYINGVQTVSATSTGNVAYSSFDTSLNNNVVHEIGRRGNGSEYFNGYLADVHFIDGQALDPTSFGEFDTNGIWQPIEYTFGNNPNNGTTWSSTSNMSSASNAFNGSTSDGALFTSSGSTLTTSSITINSTLEIYHNRTQTAGVDVTINGTTYNAPGSGSTGWHTVPITGPITTSGAITITDKGGSASTLYAVRVDGYVLLDGAGDNSFYLDFSDNSSAAALGTDTSGAGNNWTVNNIAPSDGATYSNNISLSSGSYTSGREPSKGFDGLLTTACQGDTNGTSITLSSLNGLVVSTSIEFYSSAGTGGDNTFTINGSASATMAGTNQWTSVAFTGTISSAVISSASQNPTFSAIRIDGVILVDGAAGDSFVDVPTNGTETDTGVGGEVRGNYATLNPLNSTSNTTLSNGNLDLSSGSNWGSCMSTVGFTGGKVYYETTVTASNYSYIGVSLATHLPTQYPSQNGSWALLNDGNCYYDQLGGGAITVNTGTSVPAGAVVGTAIDADNGKIWWSVNGTWIGSGSPDPATGTNAIFSNIPTDEALVACLDVYDNSASVNFGQRPFAYTAPSGFKALCTANLPAPVVTKPSEYMDVKLYTGTGSTQTVSGLGFSPDLVWGKNRADAASHQLYDTVRGAGKVIYSNLTAAEEQPADTISAFTSTGFTLDAAAALNVSTKPFVAWTWDAGSSTVSNTDGSITSSVRANTSAGFSIVTYTGTGSAATVGHGLGAAPAFIITKSRNNAFDWAVYHQSLGISQYLFLNSTAAATSSTNYWNTAPTSTIFGVDNNNTGSSGSNLVAYCFAPVDGYSSFGSYVGGANNGPFVYTGFRPRWIMVKSIESDALQDYLSWVIYDTARQPYNTGGPVRLYANRAYQEGLRGNGNTDTFSETFDILSNGFKLGGNYDIETNQPGDTYIYAAFAESPFALNARAR